MQRGAPPLLCSLQVEALKMFTQEDLLSWFLEHRKRSRKLSVHVSVCVSAPWKGDL